MGDEEISMELKLVYEQMRLLIMFMKSQPKDFLRIVTKIRAIINFLFIELQHKFLKNSYVIGFPYHLVVETGNYCNLKCVLCPTGQGRKGLPKGFLKFTDFKKIIDELGKYLIIVELYNWGEPLLNKEIFKMIRYAREKNVIVYTSSNLNILTDDICKEMVDSGLNFLMVSLDGASEESVKTYQRGNSFRKVISNLNKIVEEKRRTNSRKPFLQWRFFVTKVNESEIPKAEKLSEEIGVDYLELAQILCDMGERYFLDPTSQFENVKDWLPKNENYSAYDYKLKRRKRRLENGCSFLWSKTVMNWDGTIFPCCAVYEKEWGFGNALVDGLSKIWNNALYQSSRAHVASGGKKRSPKTICRICVKNGAMQ